LEIEMRVSPAIVPLAVVTVLAGVHAVAAQTGQSRQPTTARSPAVNAKAAGPQARGNASSPRAPTQAEKDWMDRASAASNGGAGGGM
jgi:hypothetical protein